MGKWHCVFKSHYGSFPHSLRLAPDEHQEIRRPKSRLSEQLRRFERQGCGKSGAWLKENISSLAPQNSGAPIMVHDRNRRGAAAPVNQVDEFCTILMGLISQLYGDFKTHSYTRPVNTPNCMILHPKVDSNQVHIWRKKNRVL